MNKAVFLDRDGVINYDSGYVHKINSFIFIDGIFELLQKFKSLGYLLIIITNQAGIARGYYTEHDFFILTDWMKKTFLEHNIYIDDVYFCPHHPNFTGECNCRKPNTGMIDKAILDYQIDINHSVLIGDKESDIQAGINVGIRNNILISNNINCVTKAKYIFSNLKELLEFIDGFK